MTMTERKNLMQSLFPKESFSLISSHIFLLSNQRNMEQMMKTLFLGAIILLLPNLLDACVTDHTIYEGRHTKEFIRCKTECMDAMSNNPNYRGAVGLLFFHDLKGYSRFSAPICRMAAVAKYYDSFERSMCGLCDVGCCNEKCAHLDRYVYLKHLSKPEIFLLLKFLTAPTLKDVYLLKVFSAN